MGYGIAGRSTDHCSWQILVRGMPLPPSLVRRPDGRSIPPAAWPLRTDLGVVLSLAERWTHATGGTQLTLLAGDNLEKSL